MKIAVVGPSPVPFTIGGAENLMWGLTEAINKMTEHQAELIKLPSREHNFWDLIQTYYDFYKLNLEQFDLVISTKYPSWMVRHNNSICYMVHTLRGLYDTYHCMNLPDEVDRENKQINKILDYMKKRIELDELEEFFFMLFALKEDKRIPEKYFIFPGPFIRKIIHFLDETALSQRGMKHIYSISKTVKYRKEYYPPDSRIDVVYPPTVLKKRNVGMQKHIFVASRLDAPKRIDLLIRAMDYVKGDISLYIAGDGPQRNEWEQLAKKNDRIHFLGFVDEDTLEWYYANSLVVPYFPYDEDYGLITIEAMLHKKPVITTVDAGGPNEFVVNYETGFVTKFDAKEIADKINYLVENPEEAARMGKNAYQKVSVISWESVLQGLLGCEEIKEENGADTISDSKTNVNEKNTRKITVTSTFPIYPPQGGGQARIYNLYKNLSKAYDVDIVSFTGMGEREYEGYIAENLREIRVPKSKVHQEEEWQIERKAQLPITDIGMITLYAQTREYQTKLRKSITDSDAVILSHPYLYNAVKKHISNKPLIYEAQDVEYYIKKDILPESSVKEELLKQVFQVEKECCEKSAFIMTCSKEDQYKLHELYGVSIDKMIEIPNGVDCQEICYTSVHERMDNKNKLGLGKETIGVFMGSWHQPNLEACQYIFDIASKCPETKFLLMGSQCEYFRNKKIPSNVGLLGVVSDEVKATVFSAVDFALNPMMSGSGTNLKMFDYMASGLPIITTEFGTRGIEDKTGFILSDVSEMSQKISEFSLESLEDKITFSRNYVEEHFDWKNIGARLKNKVDTIIGDYYE